MSGDEPTASENLIMNVQLGGHPVELAAEADRRDAAQRYGHYIVRGPLFALAACAPGDVGWRLLTPMTDGFPQASRDALNSRLWFRAKEDTDDPALRRELLSAVDRLESEPLDELTVAGTRYRVVRGDEFFYTHDGKVEPPRPTDPDPAVLDWDDRAADPELDGDVVIDHAAATGVMASAERLALRDLHYRSLRYPADVRADSRSALRTHPGVVLLPAAFRVVERTDVGWEPAINILATPHAARRALADALTTMWPRMYELDADEEADYARAAEEFRAAGRANELEVGGRHFSVARVARLIRVGADGPEPPRPSDVDPYGPSKIHPTMDEHGNITYDE
ncbi:DUF5954 family protein [Streptomyces sp. NPDC093221]|uniref:DUF5954 family protein n=1 Tax=Streptomyces sp. NPDC093221 TaxID=3366032 RepID=UPI00380D694F